MTFNDAETTYLASQRLGRLATIGPDGSPQVKPVGFRYNPALGTIDVTGFTMATSQKFRNVRRIGQAALVVDDIASADPWCVRFLEIRGTADAIPAPSGSSSLSDEALIRIRYSLPASELSRVRLNSDYAEVGVKPRNRGLACPGGTS